MDKSTLKCIFLSASIPVQGRHDETYINTADVIAIRDAVIALASVALPKYHLIWGGHPSITPLIVNVLEHYGIDVNNNITLYQSRQYEDKFPKENRNIGKIVLTQKGKDDNESLYIMRKKMLSDYDYVAGVFIGGMKGVVDEYDMFIDIHPNAKPLPIASTGAAAKIIYERDKEKLSFNCRLEYDLAYFSLFKDLLDI